RHTGLRSVGLGRRIGWRHSGRAGVAGKCLRLSLRCFALWRIVCVADDFRHAPVLSPALGGAEPPATSGKDDWLSLHVVAGRRPAARDPGHDLVGGGNENHHDRRDSLADTGDRRVLCSDGEGDSCGDLFNNTERAPNLLMRVVMPQRSADFSVFRKPSLGISRGAYMWPSRTPIPAVSCPMPIAKHRNTARISYLRRGCTSTRYLSCRQRKPAP